MTTTTISAPCGDLTGRIRDGVFQVFNIDYADAAPFGQASPVADGPQSGTKRTEPERELVVTVTAPAPSHPTHVPYPVLLWIHGGRYEFGHPSEPWTDASAFAKAGIVTISLGYRKGLEGFWRDSQAENFRAIDDLFLALQWGRRNAPAFGGDIDNITISGQSAGAALALTLASDRRTRGQIQRIIAMSPAFSLLAGAPLRRVLAAVGVGRAPSSEVFSRADETRVALAQKLISAASPSDPAVGPRFDSFTPTLPTMVTTTSEEFFAEPPVVAMDDMPFNMWLAKRYARTHQGTGIFPTAAYVDRPMGHVISDSAVRSYAVKVAERSVAAGLDVWAAQFEPGEGLGYAPAGRTSGAPHCIDIARFFGGMEPNHPFHQVAIDFIRDGSSRLPRYNQGKPVTTFAGADAAAVEGLTDDAWAAPRQLFGA
ncbi:MAG: carboxylesterase family protein [Corynebacterium sp.]|uniref:carboxylesterase family protein n=1 Tax=Corynebacterium sp. TaxID=1720 RepID=UPI0026DD8022|nr:carboxylesterase family protein [Corynebacterium sp.]MDO5029777.1 carboxylesterase family protein [Corynebacterium sp.]